MKIITLISIATVFLLNPKLQAMDLELKNSANGLRVALFNSSPQEIKVNKRFAYGSLGELEFVIRNSRGEKFDFQLKVRRMPLNERDWCYLGSGQFIGCEISLEEIKYAYELPNGRYRLNALYSFTSDGKRYEFASELVEVEIK